MEKKKQAVHTCSDKLATCRKQLCAGIEYDPRSYCHSICSKPHHVCENNTCGKFLKRNRRGEEKVVCAPSRACRLTRRFGPEDEDEDTLAMKVSYQEIGDQISDSQSVESEATGSIRVEKNQARTPEQLTEELLKELGLYLDEEKMKNLTILGSSEICSCCSCRVCRCERTKEFRVKKSKIEREGASEWPTESTKDQKYSRKVDDYIEKKLFEKHSLGEKTSLSSGKMQKEGTLENNENENRFDEKNVEELNDTIDIHEDTQIGAINIDYSNVRKSSLKQPKDGSTSKEKQEVLQKVSSLEKNQRVSNEDFAEEKTPNQKKLKLEIQNKQTQKKSEIQKGKESYSDTDVEDSTDDITQAKEKKKQDSQTHKEKIMGKKVSEKQSNPTMHGIEKVANQKSNTENYNQTEKKSKQELQGQETFKIGRDIQKDTKSTKNDFDGKIEKKDVKVDESIQRDDQLKGQKRMRGQVLEENPTVNRMEQLASPKSNIENYGQPEKKTEQELQKPETEKVGKDIQKDTKSAESYFDKKQKKKDVEADESIQRDDQFEGQKRMGNQVFEENAKGDLDQKIERKDVLLDPSSQREDQDKGQKKTERKQIKDMTDEKKNNISEKQIGGNPVDVIQSKKQVISQPNAKRKDEVEKSEKKSNEETDRGNKHNQIDESKAERSKFQSENNLRKHTETIPEPDVTSAQNPQTLTSMTPETGLFERQISDERSAEGSKSKSSRDGSEQRARTTSIGKSTSQKTKQTLKMNKNNSIQPGNIEPKSATSEPYQNEEMMSESVDELIPKIVAPLEGDEDKLKTGVVSGNSNVAFSEEWDPLTIMPLSDRCDCLPGYCTCGTQHHVFKKATEAMDSHQTTSKKLSSRNEIEEKESVDLSSYESSCSCIHNSPFEELELSPKLSRVEVVAVPPMEVKQTKKIGQVCKPTKYQRTLLIVKPEAVKFKDVIMRAIKKEGLDIVDERSIQITPEQVAEIYTENYGSSYFALFVQQMSSSPILVLSLAGSNAIERWSKAIGNEKKIPTSWFYPPSVKRRFGIHKGVYDAMRLSDDFDRAKLELRYFFPLGIIDPIIVKSCEVQDYCDKFIHPTLFRGLYELVKKKPIDPVMFLAEWLLINNPYQPIYKQKQVALAPT